MFYIANLLVQDQFTEEWILRDAGSLVSLRFGDVISERLFQVLPQTPKRELPETTAAVFPRYLDAPLALVTVTSSHLVERDGLLEDAGSLLLLIVLGTFHLSVPHVLEGRMVRPHLAVSRITA